MAISHDPYGNNWDPRTMVRYGLSQAAHEQQRYQQAQMEEMKRAMMNAFQPPVAVQQPKEQQPDPVLLLL